MAIITISRQVAAFGDEVASALAEKMNYKFIKRTDIEKRIISLGFPESKMPKYDERKPGFFASLAKDRDEYLDYVQYAILEAAAQKNVVIIGRGAFAVLHNIPNHVSVRLVADEKIRLTRLENEFSWDEKQARQRIEESDTNRDGFHKSFYNVNLEDASLFHAVLNTGIIDIPAAVDIIKSIVDRTVDTKKEEEGTDRIAKMFKAQSLVNKLVFEHHINIEFLHAVIENNTLTLQGVAESIAVVEQALRICRQELPDYSVQSAVSIIHDFKTFQ